MKLFRKRDKKSNKEGALALQDEHLPDISPAGGYGQEQQQQPTRVSTSTTVIPPSQQQQQPSRRTVTVSTKTIPPPQAAQQAAASPQRQKGKKKHSHRYHERASATAEDDEVVPELPPRTTTSSPSSRTNTMQQQQVAQSMSHVPTSDVNVTRELVKKFIADIWNRGDLDLIPSVCSRSLRFNGSVGMDRVGHEGFARMVQTIREALSDYHCEIHSMVVEGNKAFARMRFTGRHTGPLLGYEPTGRQVAWMGASEFTIKDGKIIKVWELGDVKSLEGQLMAPMEEEDEEEESEF